MNALKLGIISATFAAAVTVPWLIHHRRGLELRAKEESMKKQAPLLAELAAKNERLSNVVVQEKSSQSLSATQLTELLKLRSEIGLLRRVPNEMDQLRRQIDRLRDRLKDAAAEEESGREIDTALLEDEMPLRQARIARLKRWLEETPAEKIPELQFVSVDRWIHRVDRPLVTDDDYRSAIALLRADGEQKFVPIAFKALKQYAQANDGQFPTDLSALKPYFAAPIDDVILQRWEIVPAKSLVQFLAETGGDWVITQKAPINKQFDTRHAIGLTSFRGTGAEDRWDTPP